MIETRALHMVFNQDTPLENHAVRGIDLQATAGEFVTLIGPNGSGKSTFLRLLSGEHFPSGGSVHLASREITGVAHNLRAGDIAQVSQDPLSGTCAGLTIEENLALAHRRSRPRRLALAVSDRRRKIFAERLSVLGIGLENRMGDSVGLLSGGQRQALSLVMTTMAPSKVLLLDEHTAALDPHMSEFVLELTDKIHQMYAPTIIMVTHSLHDALRMGSRTVMLNMGKVVLDLSGAARAATNASHLFKTFSLLHAQTFATHAEAE